MPSFQVDKMLASNDLYTYKKLLSTVTKDFYRAEGLKKSIIFL